jgi:hypothetical protein
VGELERQLGYEQKARAQNEAALLDAINREAALEDKVRESDELRAELTDHENKMMILMEVLGERNERVRRRGRRQSAPLAELGSRWCQKPEICSRNQGPGKQPRVALALRTAV